MNRFGSRIDLTNFRTPPLGVRTHTATSEHANLTRSVEQFAETQLRPHALRLSSSETMSVAQAASAGDQTTQKIQEDFKNRFTELAGNPERFHGFINEVYGPNYDH